jgi:hypothetical protein
MPPRIVALSGSLLLALLAAGVTGVVLRGPLWQTVPGKLTVYALIVGGFALLLTGEERVRLRGMLGDLRDRLFPTTA